MQVPTWPLWVVSIPRIKSNPPFFTLSINPHTLSSYVEYYGTTYHGINYGHARNSYQLGKQNNMDQPDISWLEDGPL